MKESGEDPLGAVAEGKRRLLVKATSLTASRDLYVLTPSSSRCVKENEVQGEMQDARRREGEKIQGDKEREALILFLEDPFLPAEASSRSSQRLPSPV